MAGIVAKATVNVRRPNGRFPPGSYLAVLVPARADLARDAKAAFADAKDPVTRRPWPARKDVYDHPPLDKTGKMKRAAIAACDSATVSGNTLVARVKEPAYAKFHAKGTRLIARRRNVGASPTTLAALKRRLRGQGVKVLRGSLRG